MPPRNQSQSLDRPGKAVGQEVPAEPEIMTPGQVMEYLEISLRTYQRHIAKGYLVPAYRTRGGWRRFRRSDIEALQRDGRYGSAIS
jgi:excisionase family DNA binding protein